MKDRICPICSNIAPFRLHKTGADYNQCSSCATIFSVPLDQEGKVGGGNEAPRNEQFNPLRLERVKAMFGESKVKILDFGAGSGMYVRFMREAGYYVDGYDPYNPHFERIPPSDTYDMVNLCEVIEHLAGEYIEIKAIARSLKKGGVLVVETSFVNCMLEDGFTPETYFYLDATVGHSTLFSHHGIDILMMKHGLWPIQHPNRNVRCYIKK